MTLICDYEADVVSLDHERVDGSDAFHQRNRGDFKKYFKMSFITTLSKVACGECFLC